jgi:hypothetical protein
MDMTAFVNANSPLNATCWMADYGYPLGTVAWSSIVESEAALATAFAGLGGHEGYMDRVEAAADMVPTPGQDTLRELVYFNPEGPATGPGAIANITTATAVVDRMADAVGWSIEIAQHVEKVTGTPVAFLTDVYGTMGGVAWISVAENAAAADEGRAKMAADADYLNKITATKDLFIPGSGRVGRLTRIV